MSFTGTLDFLSSFILYMIGQANGISIKWGFAFKTAKGQLLLLSVELLRLYSKVEAHRTSITEVRSE